MYVCIQTTLSLFSIIIMYGVFVCVCVCVCVLFVFVLLLFCRRSHYEYAKRSGHMYTGCQSSHCSFAEICCTWGTECIAKLNALIAVPLPIAIVIVIVIVIVLIGIIINKKKKKYEFFCCCWQTQREETILCVLPFYMYWLKMVNLYICIHT